MKLQLLQLKLRPDYANDDLKAAIAKRLHIHPSDILTYVIERRSIDARDIFKGAIYYILNVSVEISRTLNIQTLWQVEKTPETSLETIKPAAQAAVPTHLAAKPVIIGAGPAGIFAALTLAENGLKPVVYERGKEVKERRRDVGLFWGQGRLNPQSNVLYGEGGAGTFSDGKITSRSKDKRRTNLVRKILFEAGAKEEVLYDATFHIGSDKLAEIIPKIRERIIALGGEFHFGSKLTGLHIENNALRGVMINADEIIADRCYLATGHSAYDTYNLLESAGAILEAKPFATGVRVEIPQKDINYSQYGNTEFQSLLGAAPFSLTLGKDCYTFCMCPGGSIIPCSTEAGSLFTNGMSLSSRSGKMGNAAFLLPRQFSTFAEGYNFIKEQEEAAFNTGNKDFSLPITTLDSFPFACQQLPESRSCNRATAADFTKILPAKMCEDLKKYLPQMLSKLKSVDPATAVIAGPETRSSAPVRILRNHAMECTTIAGLYPIGEGAGYAGGIMSSAIDGIKAAELSLNSY